MLTDFNEGALEFVVLNMRERDRVEIYNMRPHESPLQLVQEIKIASTGHRRIIAWSDRTKRPAGFGAFTESWPGCWDVWMFGTDDFKDVAIELIRWFRKTANDVLQHCKGHRLQCDSRFDHEEAHRMLRALGAIEEVRLRKEAGEHVERVEDTVRHTEVDVEDERSRRGRK